MPRSVRNASGSNRSSGPGSRACRTWGSARAARAWRTPSQTLSRVRGSAWTIGVEGVGPAVCCVAVAGQDGDGVLGQDGVERPPVQVQGAPVVEGCGVQQAAQCGLGLAGPEVRVRHRSVHAGARGEAAGADEGDAGVLAAADRGPAQPVGEAGEALGVEHRDRAARGAVVVGDGEGVGAGGGGDDGAGGVEDPGDDHVQALAHSGRAEEQRGVLHRAPQVAAVRRAEEVAELGGGCGGGLAGAGVAGAGRAGRDRRRRW